MSTSTPQRHRLLLAYIARVQQSGDCSYPALEAHLHQHARALKAQAAQPDPGQQAIEPAAPEAPVDPADAAPMEPSVELPAQAPHAASPEGSAQAASDTDRAPGSAPMGGPMPAREVPRALAAAPGTTARSSGRTEAAAPSARQAAKPRLGATGTGPGHGLEPLGGKEPAPEWRPAVPAPSFLPEPQPRLELLLRFRERVQATGVCDNPALQQRMEEHLRSREPAQALERHRQDCIQQLQAALGLLAELQQPAAPSAAAMQATALTAATLMGELRLQLQDGLSSYGLPLDPRQRRLMQRMLQRAARREGRLQRHLQGGVPAASLLSELQALAQVLRSAALQCMPEALMGDAWALGHQPTVAASASECAVRNGIRPR